MIISFGWTTDTLWKFWRSPELGTAAELYVVRFSVVELLEGVR